MGDYFNKSDIKPFNWEELDGKTLKISVGKDITDGVKATTVMGQCQENGQIYVIHSEVIPQ